MTKKNNGNTDPKRRIFEAAAALFVNKGYSAIGVREIAKEAGVNIAMINYYFGGKSGILKDILEDAFGKYYQAQASAGDNSTPPEERVRNLVTNVVHFFRENTTEALIFFNCAVLDIPELKGLKEKWRKMYSELMLDLFLQMGVDLKDPVHANIYNGFLGGMIKNHFQFRHELEKNKKTAEACNEEDCQETKHIEFDDLFYQRYVDLLVNQYFHGVIYATQKDKMKYGPK
ncbi:MAG: hypothetical protein A2509_09415 [Candidatus Edwardsbacteria bacterium RIFOXYD12_FULL_50_11]|jgi:AcrR family transcriptional regulator|uniref:HTH tetR-type domain-containing protein n=1 Tax=Candidatus Edwardsbacteria bacterium GWF2_54_11 TaxID=1817851 RepID=A0A1F5R607_9BACT|nr:MAG: hypothetical protein A2502_08455 [Candidatus Edwardsbacteria bacterium RifOxyC12_full_54_24]OGF07379.1 MAG: hypothetical protein A2273_02600 [Candidatus Edwardsbacteria bacterium RifOxyA12_full_54_48]OGF09453.1 MAG: hypothetical protein A2024_01690 [Candidatus Edwardsbacteria bacterium GWF2_54_11]OGF09631.1 MAG: hypothetical protein A3K15_09010 [Candidatus Edwardsbacteria bacterium GWE2_54_12]OGF18074.1 MAG: hypothetical protein A2509_09415 [Candidatus Edwardsbacteria bacterium RIFOXYD1